LPNDALEGGCEGEVNRQATLCCEQWEKCLSTCYDVILRTNDVLNTIQSPALCSEVVYSSTGSKFIAGEGWRRDLLINFFLFALQGKKRKKLACNLKSARGIFISSSGQTFFTPSFPPSLTRRLSAARDPDLSI